MSYLNVTIIICTHNRASLLEECLNCFGHQDRQDFELLIVDNISSDNTASIAQKFVEGKDWADYSLCSVLGLSHARNHGAHQARSAWIGYVDDDALVESDFISNVLKEIELGEFDAFGGVYHPWYKYGRPCWFSDTYGGNVQMYPEGGRRALHEHEYFSGGIAFYRRQLLIEGDSFPGEFGMKGNVIGYGEENVVQEKIRSLGGVLGISPSISMMHLVAPYKLHLSWHLKSQYESGRAHVRQYGRELAFKRVSYFLIGPILRLKKVRRKDFKNLRGWVFGSFVAVLRGVSYYWGRL